MDITLPVFLGTCQKASFRFEGLVQDLYGVTDYLALHFFPLSLEDLLLLMAFPKDLCEVQEPTEIVLRNSATGETASLGLSMKTGMIKEDYIEVNAAHVEKPCFQDPTTQKYMTPRLMISESNTFKMLPVPCPNLFIPEPSDIVIYFKVGDHEHKLGTITCRFVPPPPITESERNALMSRPSAYKMAVMQLTCNKCQDRTCFHVSLDGCRSVTHESVESIPIMDAPDFWKCKCQHHNIPLCYLKQGMHVLFRILPPSGAKKRLGVVPLYEKNSIMSMLSEYQTMLIEQVHDKEEVFQQYLQEHPLFWNFLAPVRLWHKPPISTKYNADFAILTSMRVLYFVEIEKPKTTLMKSDGGVHSELQAGLDQVRDWRIEIDKRREAVLSGLDLEQKDVHDIRYIVVAGLANRTGVIGMEKVRKMKTDADVIFCFDELASFLHSTQTALTAL